MANNLKQQIMEYLNTQGFANDGFGTPIPQNAKAAIASLLDFVKSPTSAERAYFALSFQEFADKIRNEDLRECIKGLPSVDFIKAYRECSALIARETEGHRVRLAVTEAFEALKERHEWVLIDENGRIEGNYRALWLHAYLLGKGLPCPAQDEFAQFRRLVQAYQMNQQKPGFNTVQGVQA